MKIGIDLKPFFTGSKYRGIGMYANELIKELINVDSASEFHYLNMYSDYEGLPEMGKNCFLHNYFTGQQIVDVGEHQLYDRPELGVVLEAQVQHFLEKSDIDLMFFTSPNEYGNLYKKEWFDNVYTVGILYDLIPLLFPDQFLFDNTYRKDYEKSIKFIKNLDLLLAISQATKDDAVRLLGIPEKKIIVIHAGIDKDFKKLSKVNLNNIKEKYGISDPFILYAGGIDFKKNIEMLIKAYSKLDNSLIKRYQLVITGKTSEDIIRKFYDLSEEYGVKDRVICTGYIPKTDLIELYNITELLAFPSLYEGFGLPVIEAMACGARVVTSENSSLGEIAKGYATLINPKSIRSLTRGIQTVLNSPIESLNLAEKAMEYANTYTWKKVAKISYEAMETLSQVKKERKFYHFDITDSILKNIVTAYIENGLELTDILKEKIANELFGLSNHEDFFIFNGGTRIIYDVTVVREWLKAGYCTGIGRVCNELYKSISKLANTIPVAVSQIDDEIEFSIVSMNSYDVTNSKLYIKEGDIFLMPELQLRGVQVENNHPKANQIRQKGTKCYAVVYDILPLQFPEYFEKKTVNSFGDFIDEIFNNYDGILSDSKSVSNDLINYYHNTIKNKLKHNVNIGYFHLGQNSFNDKIVDINNNTLKSFLETSQHVFFMLGTIEPRKGHDLVLKAFEKLWEEGNNHKLCIIGHSGWNMNKFVESLKNHKEQNKRLLFVEAASDAEVCYTYQHTSALIQASAGEGFGLPLIEAGYYNLPIICSDIPVFHEVAQENALYFNRNSVEDIIVAITEFIEKDNKNSVPCSKNIVPLSWNDVAKKVYNMIENSIDWYAVINTEGSVYNFE